jgi:hypothetical protein
MKKIGKIIIYFLFLILIVGVMGMSATAQSFSNSGGGVWEYYRSITITETSGENLTDYQILVELPRFYFPINAQKSGADIRFTDVEETELSYWIENWNYSESAKIWVKVPSLPANSSIKINMLYGNPKAISMSNPINIFIKNSIYLMMGECVVEKNCKYMDNHEEANFIRYYTADIGSKYVSKINWGYAFNNSIPGSNESEKFYSRFRFLFFPDAGGEWTFAVDSDEGSELIKNPGDSTHPIDEKVLADWYGGHEMCICQTHSGNETLEAGIGVWMDYIMEEWTGNESAVVWIKKPGKDYWRILDSDNFPNQIFARKYTPSEPYIEYVPKEGGTPPHLKVSPDFPEHAWGILNPGDSYSIRLDIGNTGGGELEWYISKDQPWITVNPTSGRNSGTVTINTSTAGLNPGRYLGNINVYSNGGNKTIKMSGNISPTPTLPAISPTTPTPTITPTQINGPIISDTVIVALIGALATIITAYLTYRAAKKK